MKKLIKSAGIIYFILFLGMLLHGCVNYEQKTKLNEDGSGEMHIHYWSKISDVNSGSGSIGRFSFIEDKIMENYSSDNNGVNEIKIEDDLLDSTRHVNIKLTFRDINNLKSCWGFSDIEKISWKISNDEMEFKYSMRKDSAISDSKDAYKYKLIYEFKFPGIVLYTNGSTVDDNIIWDKTLEDIRTNDLIMTATVKTEK